MSIDDNGGSGLPYGSYTYLVRTFDKTGNLSGGSKIDGISESLSGTVIYPDDLGDTFIYETDPTGKDGSEISLFAGNKRGALYSVLRFDISQLTGKTVQSAMLLLKVSNLTGYQSEETFYVYRIIADTTPWSETEATWESLIGLVDTSKPYSKFTVTPADVGVQINVDITELVLMWQNEQAMYFSTNGLAIVPTTDTQHYFAFDSKEGTTAPELKVKVQ